jgi:competence protein ComEC
VPAALLVALCAATPRLVPVPAWAPAGLAAAGVALGGGMGAALVGAGAGLSLGELRRTAEVPEPAGRVAEVEGEICGPWRARAELASRSARLCPRWLRLGRELVLTPPSIQLDLAEKIAPPPYGSEVRARGTLARFPGLANATPVAPGPWRLRVKAGRFVAESARPGSFARWSGALRARLERAIAGTGAGELPGVALVKALVLGDESGMSEDRRRALRRAGLAHLFAVSGFNLTVVAAFASLVSGAGPRGGRRLLPALAVLGYLAAVGPEPSMLRASIMSVLGLALLAAGRAGSAPQALALAAAALVAAEPSLVDDVGFQLSFGATAGLVAGTRGWLEPFARLPRPLAAALGVSIAAQLGALPFAVATFGELSPVAPLVNLVAVPWAAIWLLGGMAWLALALALPAVAGELASWLGLGAAPFALLERLPPSPWISLDVAASLAVGGALATALGLALARRSARRWLPLLALSLSVPGVAAPARIAQEVAYLDVGQGDAAIVRDGGFVALVDGGGLVGRDLGATVLRRELAARGAERIDVAILSHSDRDHCRGLLDLATLLPIAEVWSSAGQLERGCGAQLAQRTRGPRRALAAGDVIRRAGARFEILHPSAGERAAEANAESLVVVVELGGRRFLFGGDLAATEEREVAERRGAQLAADVLKVSHHGARGSTAEQWIVAVRPRWAVVSAGARNAYGHPAPATLARLRAAGATVLRTDRDGEIVFSRQASGPWRLELPGSPRAVSPPR